MAKVILVAEDDDADAFAIGRTLAKSGIKNSFKRAHDGAEVIAYFKGDGPYADRKKFPIPSVLLLDLKMPGIGGFAVLEWLKDSRLVPNRTLIVLVSGYYNDENLRRACSLGVRSFFIKPCTLGDFWALAHAYPSYWETDPSRRSLGIPPGHSGTGGARVSGSR